MMTTDQKQLIQATIPTLKAHGLLLTTHFYQRLFSFNPEMKNMFNMGNQQTGHQPMALATAVLAYAEHIDDPSVLGAALNRIGHKHTSLDIRPQHYSIIGRHLLASIGEVLGNAATPELLDAWGAAYAQLASLMIGTEADLYAAQVNRPGGWAGWRLFVVNTKVADTSQTTVFHLYPADGNPVADHQPGQYLSLRLFLPELNLLQPQQYRIASEPNLGYYRIVVERDGATRTSHDRVSNHLLDVVQPGDRIEVSAPAGMVMAKVESPATGLKSSKGVCPMAALV